MGQEEINTYNSNIGNIEKKKQSSTLELAKKLGIVNNKKEDNSRDDLLRLETILKSNSKREKRKSQKISKKLLTEDDLSYLTKVILDDRNIHILKELLENVETSELSGRARGIIEYVENKREDKNLDLIESNKSLNKTNILEPELVNIFNDSKETVDRYETKLKEDKTKVDDKINISTLEVKDKDTIQNSNIFNSKEEIENIEVSTTTEDKNTNDLLKLLLEEESKQTVESIDTVVTNDNIEQNFIKPTPKEDKIAEKSSLNSVKVEKEVKSVESSNSIIEDENTNDLLKLILDDDNTKTTESVDIIDIKSEKEEKHIQLNRKEDKDEEEIKVDKFYIVGSNEDKRDDTPIVTPEDIDSFLAKRVTYEDKNSVETKGTSSVVNLSNYNYIDISGVSTILKAIIYPLIVLLPLIILSWLTGKLKIQQSYLDQIEPYRNTVLRFINENNIDIKFIKYGVIVLVSILFIIYTISFLKRLIIHFKNSKILTDKRYSYISSKKYIFFTYFKTFLLILVSIGVFVSIIYALIYFTSAKLYLQDINVQSIVSSIVDYLKGLYSKYIN